MGYNSCRIELFADLKHSFQRRRVGFDNARAPERGQKGIVHEAPPVRLWSVF
jgi:hypothetical protein